MIKDNFYIENWNIIILYECTCNDIDVIIETLKDIQCPNKYINEALKNLEQCTLNSGLTYSNVKLKSSVIIINKTSSIPELVNTISHEIFHLVCHLKIQNEERAATLNGNLNMRSYKFIKLIEESRL